ncbi:LysR family transcriptional regulator [Skermanella stibiiresistens SB22]|uniref:LysR family transcriptional regulator n=1 Tax=Skermanella stibiiresistens SB22 TaxID=1385369 RepID=W9HAV2_9PROT|nr:LysR substrate-binding domain-containing protein [Skermanella stibiiresistens]EWY40988.1 LysR family transcriptional regulator [Skermanella stibiiresistens SB22]
MNQRDIEYFVKVVEAGSFSQAAILLGKTQPVLSRHVRDLETDLRVPLLYRNGRGVVLTEAGERLYARATSILEQLAEARTEMLNLCKGGIDSANIGMPPTVARILTVPLARTLYAAYPDIKLRFTEAFNGHLLEWLTNGRIDLAVLYANEATQRLNAEPLLTERMHLVASAERGPLPPRTPSRELPDLPLVLPSRNHGLRQQVETWATRQGMTLNVHAECDSISSMLRLVEGDMGCAILPEAAIQGEIEAGKLVSSLIVEPFLERSLVLATPTNRCVSSGMGELVRLIKRQMRALETPAEPAFAPPGPPSRITPAEILMTA